MTVENFDPEVHRTAAERMDAVYHEDCPLEFAIMTATHDTERMVIEACICSPHYKTSEELRNIIRERLDDLTDEEYKYLERKKLASLEWIKVKHAFCISGWNHLSTKANGTARMCCQMISGGDVIRKEDGSVLTTSDDIDANRNSPTWKELRAQMLAGVKPDICSLCWDDEDNGLHSKRMHVNSVWTEEIKKALVETEPDGTIVPEDFPLQHFDVRFGNNCNLACRTCGPDDSNMWYSDWLSMKGEDSGVFPAEGRPNVIARDEKGNITDSGHFEWFKDGKFTDYLKKNADHIQRIYFTGGEPTINKEHKDLLDHFIKSGHAGGISLDYNTNMAAVPSGLFEQWSHFNTVFLGMSLDGMGEQFEYIRHPGKWKAVERNLKKISNLPVDGNIKAGFTVTVQILNVLHLLDLQDWLFEQNFNNIEPWLISHNLYGPDHLDIRQLPEYGKNYVHNFYKRFLAKYRDTEYYEVLDIRFGHILAHMDSEDRGQFDLFIKTTSKLDEIRGQNFRETFPELKPILDKYESEDEEVPFEIPDTGKQRKNE